MFGRSRDSGKMSLVLDRGRPQTSSLKVSVDIDPELKDDGTSPAKRVEKESVERSGKPKCLAFEEVVVGVESGAVDGEGQAQDDEGIWRPDGV